MRRLFLWRDLARTGAKNKDGCWPVRIHLRQESALIMSGAARGGFPEPLTVMLLPFWLSALS